MEATMKNSTREKCVDVHKVRENVDLCVIFSEIIGES